MTAPLQRVLERNVAAVAIAASDDTVLGQAEFDATVTRVEYIPEAVITGVNTNTRRVELRNAGQGGAGAVVPASLQFNAGTNAAANDERVLTLSGTAADLLVTAGDTLVWRSAAVGTGLADPGGLVRVTLSRR
jgi:hypothetical protein